MTQSWPDIKNADVVLLMGSNAAENHPMGFKFIQQAKAIGGKLINVDPRFCRSSSQADIHAYMRSGTDIAFIGGMIKYAIDNNLYNDKYVKECTNALLKIRTDFKTCPENGGVFSGLTGGTYNATLAATLDASYSKTTWEYDFGDQAWQASYSFALGAIVRPTTSTNYHYECTVAGTSGATEPTWPTVVNNTVADGTVTWKCIYKRPKLAANLNDPDCVFQKLKTQFDGYTKAKVCAITGTDPVVYEQVCEAFCSTYPDDKSATILYAMGTTQHTVGTQNIRSYTILQMLLGNIGVAGGGINALRGQDNVQGATDQAVLQHLLPGYLKVPTPAQSTLALYNAANYNVAQTVQPALNYTVRGAAKTPPSLHWWNNGTKYIASMLKAWWPAIDHTVSYTYLSRKTADYTILSMFDAMYNGQIAGAIFDGENPAVSDPDSEHVRHALGNLSWLVCIDPFEQETAAFWKRPGVDPATINTTVYLLPAAVALEKWGSRSDSGRWQQWHWKGGNSPGQARSDMDIITDLGQRLKALISDAPVANLSWPCLKYTGETDDALAELIAKEMHGYNMIDTNADGIPDTPTTLVSNFVGLTNTGTTACGNWLSSGSFVDPAAALDTFENNPLYTNLIWSNGGVRNRMKRRYPTDVGQLGWGVVAGVGDYKKIGLYSYWSWCWPINRRIVYNRAATYQSDGGSSGAGLAGDPLAPNKYVMKWVPTNPPPADQLVGSWKGDQWDGGAAPASAMPYIMNKEGFGHHFGGWTVAEGPFPWHYEPAESPIAYPSWLGTYRMNPAVHFYPGSAFATHGGTTYNIFATSYRLTEHWHTGAMTRNLPRANELQPEPFVEMSEELAADTTAIPTGPIANGDLVRVTSARGSIEVKACVTKRLRPLNGVHQVGVIWHWGYMGLSKGDSGNILTPFIGDANTRIPESKCFMVKIEKV
jgi:anaerobic selenocysteine-containing dehydrogenase